MNARTVRASGGVAATIGALLVGAAFAIPASAHTPSIHAECTQATSFLTVNLASYNTAHPNTVKVTIDGATVADTTFGASFSATYDGLAPDVTHTYRVIVDAWDDGGGKGFDVDQAGSIEACAAPDPTPTVTTPVPTTPAPTTPAPTTPAPTTPSATPTPSPTVTTPAPTTPAPTYTPPPDKGDSPDQPTTAAPVKPAPKPPVAHRVTPRRPAPTPTPVPAAPRLAETGYDTTIPLIGGGLTFLVFGAALLVVARNRAVR